MLNSVTVANFSGRTSQRESRPQAEWFEPSTTWDGMVFPVPLVGGKNVGYDVMMG